MNILLVYPEFPDTFWSFKYALKFVSKKAAYPPLGLLTVAAMLPKAWEKKLVDMNVEKLRDSDLQWADYVMISAMSVQSRSADSVIARCKKAGVKTIAGGPLFTAWPEKYDAVDYLVLNEAELTLPAFLGDLQNGSPKHIYQTGEWPDLSKTPQPLWELVNMRKYANMNIQYSRGCPFNCDFCDIVVLFGRKPRLKSAHQVVEELQSLYDYGWRGGVFFVDDNFIGNKELLKSDILPAIIDWLDQHDNPFTFHTEASINISDDEELMRLMVKAGFTMVFIGIESPNEESLSECNKQQNKNRNLITCIDRIQKYGMEVQGGFILGFDNDPDSIFDTMIRFIQESDIIVAMVGLLNAPRGTKLFQRLEKQHRITSGFTGDNTDFSMNFIPKMAYEKLLAGYKKVVDTVYAPRQFYKRVTEYLDSTMAERPQRHSRIHMAELNAFFKSVFKLGIVGEERREYWKLLFHMLRHNPSHFPKAVAYAIYGYHFRKIYKI